METCFSFWTREFNRFDDTLELFPKDNCVSFKKEDGTDFDIAICQEDETITSYLKRVISNETNKFVKDKLETMLSLAESYENQLKEIF